MWSLRSRSLPADTEDGAALTRRRFGRAVAVGVPAAVLAAGAQPAQAAAPPSWATTGDAGTTAGPNYLGTRDAQALVVKTNSAERLRVLATGLIGIGTVNPAARLHAVSGTTTPVRADYSGTAAAPAVRATSHSKLDGACGVLGALAPTAMPGPNSAGVLGAMIAPYPAAYEGVGVIGHHTAGGTGVHGYCDGSGIGVYAQSAGGEGVVGTSTAGGSGGSFSSDYGVGVAAYSQHDVGLSTESEDGGPALVVSGYGAADGASIYSYAGNGLVVHAGDSDNVSIAAISATNGPGTGIYAATNGASSTAVYGHATGGGDGAIFLTDTGLGVYAGASGSGGTAGYFDGDVRITGTLVNSAAASRIDHPDDPAGRYLTHAYVGSPDMINVYGGNAVLDARGRATVQLPSWFETVHGDVRYQLTPIGAHAPVYVSERVRGNRFGIAGGTPGMEVSWQVTGVRRDRFAAAHRIAVDEPKPAPARGRYLDPQGYGRPAADGEGHLTKSAPRVPEHRRPRPARRRPGPR